MGIWNVHEGMLQFMVGGCRMMPRTVSGGLVRGRGKQDDS